MKLRLLMIGLLVSGCASSIDIDPERQAERQLLREIQELQLRIGALDTLIISQEAALLASKAKRTQREAELVVAQKRLEELLNPSGE